MPRISCGKINTTRERHWPQGWLFSVLKTENNLREPYDQCNCNWQPLLASTRRWHSGQWPAVWPSALTACKLHSLHKLIWMKAAGGLEGLGFGVRMLPVAIYHFPFTVSSSLIDFCCRYSCLCHLWHLQRGNGLGRIGRNSSFGSWEIENDRLGMGKGAAGWAGNSTDRFATGKFWNIGCNWGLVLVEEVWLERAFAGMVGVEPK